MSSRSFLLLGFVSRSAVYAAECTDNELAEISVELSKVSPVCLTEVESYPAPDKKAFCAKQGCYKEAAEFVFPDCTANGLLNLKEDHFKNLATDFEENCTSDAHGWSAVHYMLATVLPMALLWV